MEWEISFKPENNLLSVKTYGIFNMDSNTALIKECLEIVKKKDCHDCLIDNSKLEFTKIKTLEIYSIPALFSKLGVPQNLHIAEVFSVTHEKYFHFLETVCYNNGYTVSVFSEIELALQWLKKKSK